MKANTIALTVLPSLYFPNFVAEHDTTKCGISLCSPGQLSWYPQPVPWWGERQSRSVFCVHRTLCKRSSAITKTSCHQHCFHHKSKVQAHLSYCEENELCPSLNDLTPVQNLLINEKNNTRTIIMRTYFRSKSNNVQTEYCRKGEDFIEVSDK